MRFRNILTALYFIFNIYSFGGGVMEGIMNRPAWKFIAAADFPAFHQSIASRIYLFFVPIFFLSIPVSILMIWFGHQAISRKLLVATAVINSVILAVTIALAIPIQQQLDEAKSIEMIDKLIYIDLYFRTYPGLVGMIFNFLMLHQILRKATEQGHPGM